MYTMHKETQTYTSLEDTDPEPKTAAYYFKHFIRPVLAELFGVMFFVLVGVTCLCPNANGTARIATALAHGFILFVMVAVTAKAR